MNSKYVSIMVLCVKTHEHAISLHMCISTLEMVYAGYRKAPVSDSTLLVIKLNFFFIFSGEK
jgi:hypothetical protein